MRISSWGPLSGVKISKKLAFIPIIFGGVLLFTVLLFGQWLRDLRRNTEHLRSQEFSKVGEVAEQLKNISQVQVKIIDLLMKAENSFTEEQVYTKGIGFIDEIREIHNSLSQIEMDYILEPSERIFFEELKVSVREYRDKSISSVELATVDLTLSKKQLILATRAYAKLSFQLTQMLSLIRKAVDKKILEIEDQAKDRIYMAGTFFVFALIFIAIFLLLIGQEITGPLQALAGLAKRFSEEEDLTERFEVRGDDEISDLALAFNSMLDKIGVGKRKLQERTAQLSGILSAAPDSIVTIDQMGIIIDANRAVESIFGYTTEEIVGKNVNVLMPKPFSEEHDGYLKKYRETKEKTIIGTGREVVALTKDGSMFPAYLSVGEATVSGEKIYTGILQDISHFKKSQEEVLRSKEFLDNVLESLGEVLIVTDQHGRLTRVNRKARAFLGDFGKDIEGFTIFDFLQEIQAEGLPRKIFSEESFQLIEEKAIVDRPFEFALPDGSEDVPVRVTASVLWGKAHSVGGYIFAITDARESKVLQELKSTQELLVESAKMRALGQMAGGIAHEINNPLTIIAGSMDFLRVKAQDHELDDQESERTFQKVEATISRISNIIKGLMTVSREGNTDPLAPMVLMDVIEDVKGLVFERCRYSGIDLKIEIDPILEKTPVLGRRVPLSQVLINLINNSYDAISDLPKKWISIQATVEKDEIHLRVTDSGRGISEDSVPYLFDPFYTTKPVGAGTGLGLSLGKTIIQAQNGELTYELYEGHTSFLITLPFGISANKSVA